MWNAHMASVLHVSPDLADPCACSQSAPWFCLLSWLASQSVTRNLKSICHKESQVNLRSIFKFILFRYINIYKHKYSWAKYHIYIYICIYVGTCPADLCTPLGGLWGRQVSHQLRRWKSRWLQVAEQAASAWSQPDYVCIYVCMYVTWCTLCLLEVTGQAASAWSQPVYVCIYVCMYVCYMMYVVLAWGYGTGCQCLITTCACMHELSNNVQADFSITVSHHCADDESHTYTHKYAQWNRLRHTVSHHCGVDVANQVVRDRSVGANFLATDSEWPHENIVGMHLVPFSLQQRHHMPCLCFSSVFNSFFGLSYLWFLFFNIYTYTHMRYMLYMTRLAFTFAAAYIHTY